MKEITGHMIEQLERMLLHYHDLSAGAFTFSRVPEFRDVSKEKPYSYRTDVAVQCLGSDAGKLTAIGFRPGDGTGAESDKYNLGNLTIPGQYVFERNPGKVVPRQKAENGVECELMLPMFTINADPCSDFGEVYKGAVCLEELTLGAGYPHKVKHYGLLGSADAKQFIDLVKRTDLTPMIYLTTGTLPWGRRFGDPHSIVFTDLGYGRRAQKEKTGDHMFFDKLVQVAGFLPVNARPGHMSAAVERMFDLGFIGFPHKLSECYKD